MPQDRLVWIDLEMTGLDPELDQILEVAAVITDSQLNVIANGPNITVKCELARLQAMDKWNTEHHKKSGLWAACLESPKTISVAESEILNFVSQHTLKGKSPLCGNSIWQDRRFICKHMPAFEAFLHYRIVDVSSFKEMYRRWHPDLGKYIKKESHRALDDILESIEELKFYKDLFHSPRPA